MSQINSQNGNTLLFTGFFPPCRVATTGANIMLDGLQTIDSIALNAGDRVLVKDQTDATTNGIYAASTGVWVRTSDAASNSQFFDGMSVVISRGAQNRTTLWVCTTTDDPVVIGTSQLTFANFTTINSVSPAMQPVTQALTLAAARTAFGLGSAALESVGRYGIDDDGAGFLRTSGPVQAVSTTQSITGLNHNKSYVVTGAVTLDVAASGTVWNGFRFKVYTKIGATATVTLSGSDTFPDQGTGTITIPAGMLAEITTDGAGSWYATPIGGWQNARIPITAATAITNVHDGATLDIGGGSFFAVTISGGGTLNARFRCVVVNTENTPIAKCIKLNGTNFYLYPGQSFLIYNNNGTLHVLGGDPVQAGTTPKRCVVNSLALFVDGTNGSDDPTVADGLSTGARAFKTIGRAIAILYQNFDHNGSFPIITIAAGTYNESIKPSGNPVGAPVWFLNGASSNTVNWCPAAGGTPYCFLPGDLVVMEYSNINFDIGSSGYANATFIELHQNVIADQNAGVGFGSAGSSSGSHVTSDGCGATYNVNAGYSVFGAGGAATHFNFASTAQLNHAGSITVVITNSPNIGLWLRCFGGLISLGGSVTWTGSPLAGGQKWSCGPKGWISLGGNGASVPGTVAGSPVAGAAPTATSGWVTA